MGKTDKKKPKGIINGKYYPLVSVCTPTFNRRPFIPMMFECYKNQTYPKSRMEWIIVDDGTDKIKDLVQKINIPEIKYFEIDKKMTLGQKRNYMHTHATGNIIVYMDDDDYYPPERVEHAVDRLQSNKDALCAGSSEIYIYFKHIQKMYQAGPYGPNHATAGTFAFRSELLKQTRYEDDASLAEEKHFLKNYTIPFVQLDPLKTILVFSHIHNTFDKRKLLDNQHPNFFKESCYTVNMFIRNPEESYIKQFFMKDIETLLNKYKPGHPDMKPDVIQQIVKIEKERASQMQQMQQNQSNTPKFLLNNGNNQPIEMSPQDIINILEQQRLQLESMQKQLDEKDAIIKKLQMDLVKNLNKKSNPVLEVTSNKLSNSTTILNNSIIINEPSKTEPIITLDVSD